MRLIHHTDPEELGALAARWLLAELASRTVAGDRAVLGLPGGRSIQPLCRGLLAEADTLERSAWQRLELFLVDERLVTDASPERNAAVLDAHLFEPALERGLISNKQIHLFRFDPSATDRGVGAYEKELAACGGRFDVIVLGAGEDGHIAALFPEHGSIQSEAPGFLAFNDSPKPPMSRMSASRRLLLGSSAGLLLAVGESKRAALEAVLAPEGSIEQTPARLVRELPHVAVATDCELRAKMPN